MNHLLSTDDGRECVSCGYDVCQCARPATDVCGRCDGTGLVPWYMHVKGGVCFQCAGSGKVEARPVAAVCQYCQESHGFRRCAQQIAAEGQGVATYPVRQAAPAKAMQFTTRFEPRPRQKFTPNPELYAKWQASQAVKGEQSPKAARPVPTTRRTDRRNAREAAIE
jgi:hypothetical protein